MSTRKRYSLLFTALFGIAAFTLQACSSTRSSLADSSEISGGQVWAQNCSRCHNMRSPEDLSDTEWDVLVNHMGWRAYLTLEERDAIATFLKASN